MSIQRPTEEQQKILDELKQFGYEFEIGIKRDLVSCYSYVRCFNEYYTIEEAVNRYYNVYGLGEA